jgi:phosphoglycerate dehydrogenase-like enzyme
MLVGALDRELPGFIASATPRLSFVQRIYTGVDGFPFDRLPPTVRVAGNVGAYAPFVAEHAVALALAAGRTLVDSHDRVRRGQMRPPPEHRLLFRRTAVILGYGEIGRAIADRLVGFEMRVVGVNRTGRMAPGCVAMYPEEALATAVAEGDFVFDARPLTRTTRGSVDSKLLAAMRSEAVYVNVGRAGTVNEKALFRHLVEHPSFRAALDVWWGEDFEHGRLVQRFPFADQPNFVGTPHVAGFGPGVETYVIAKALENVGRFFRGEVPRNVVDRREYTG